MTTKNVMKKFDELIASLRANESSPHHGGCQNCYGARMDDAADEIERLRDFANNIAGLDDRHLLDVKIIKQW